MEKSKEGMPAIPIPMEALKYGAIVLGLVVLFYTAYLLKQELARERPRVEARNLILTYMGFGLALFGLAAFLQLREKSMEMDADATKLAAAVGRIAESLDTNLGAKFNMAVRSMDAVNLLYSTQSICNDIRDLKAAVGIKEVHCAKQVSDEPQSPAAGSTPP